jgi:hypothetical protein
MGEIPIFYVDLEGVAMSSNVFQFYPPLASHQGHPQQSPAMLDRQGLWLAPFPLWHHVLWLKCHFEWVTMGCPCRFFNPTPKQSNNPSVWLFQCKSVTSTDLSSLFCYHVAALILSIRNPRFPDHHPSLVRWFSHSTSFIGDCSHMFHMIVPWFSH